ncbi:MAG: response regulator [Gluconacetobacter diazotrophicus]|nr:response regulator [Gluconacetobacter diazotrophicus]
MCVVLVEDEPLIREMLGEALRDAGYDVLEVENGRRAVELARAPPRRFTGLVTDFHMPGGIDGYEVANEFRDAFPDIPVIVVSGRPDILDPRWQAERGFATLRKPFRPSQLIESLRAVLPPHDPGPTPAV